MWNLSEIKQKQKYILERLKNCTNPAEKEKLELSLITHISLLNNSGTLYTKFYNIMDKITKEKFSLSRNSQYIEMEQNLLFEQPAFFDKNYLQFLLTLANNVSSQDEYEDELMSLNISDEDLIKISSNFYSQLGDVEIKQNSDRILRDPSALNISKNTRDGYQDFSGITYNDYIFNKSYCRTTKSNTLFDLQVLNHEVMHGIDFYMHPKIPSKNYFGFHEVPTYTIDYLFLDYLEELGFDKNETQKLRVQKHSYLSALANLTLTQIKGQLIRKKGLKVSQNPNIDDIYEVITPQLKKQLLEVQSCIIAYGLSEQISINKELGINNLKQFMKNDIPKNQIPNFSFIGLSDEVLLQMSQQLALDNINKKGITK